MLETIRKLFAYDEWATVRVLKLLKATPGQNQKALGLLAHLLLAEKIWLLRLEGQDTAGINKSPALSLAECESLANENQRAYADFLGTLGEADLDSMLTYRNLKGTEFSTPVRDILTHVALHGTYHRGQIASAMRAEGNAPVDTDFITFVRAASAG
jgi:uncharacterized damage-inducible protein DinB